MLNKQHIATFAAASVAWGLFALTVGTNDLNDGARVSTDVATNANHDAKGRTGLPRALHTIAPTPLGPLAFDSDQGDDQLSERAAADADVATDVAPSRNQGLVTNIMVESAGLRTVAEATVPAEGTDLSLSVGSLPTLAAGEQGDITLVLGNAGPAPATTELIAYDLPPGVELGAPGPNGCIVEDRQVLCWVTWTLEPGDDTLVTIPVVLVETQDSTGPIPGGWAGIVVSETVDPNSNNDSVSVAPHRAAGTNAAPTDDQSR